RNPRNIIIIANCPRREPGLRGSNGQSTVATTLQMNVDAPNSSNPPYKTRYSYACFSHASSRFSCRLDAGQGAVVVGRMVARWLGVWLPPVSVHGRGCVHMHGLDFEQQ